MPPDDRPFSAHPKASSTAAGCVIPISVTAVVAFLVGWGAYTFYQQYIAIKALADPGPLAIEPAAPEAAALEDLGARIEAFADAPGGVLTLDADDLNALIATRPELAPNKSMIRIDSIHDGAVHCTMSFPVRYHGYLNGNLSFTPKVADHQFFLYLQSFVIPGKTVEEGFVSGYRNNRYLDSLFLFPFEEDGPVWDVIQSIGEVEVGDGTVTLKRRTTHGGGPG